MAHRPAEPVSASAKVWLYRSKITQQGPPVLRQQQLVLQFASTISVQLLTFDSGDKVDGSVDAALLTTPSPAMLF